MQNSGIKWFQTSKFFACGGLIYCFLIIIKEVSGPGIESFQPSELKMWQAHIIRFNKRNVRSWKEKVSSFKIVRMRLAHIMCFNKQNVRYWNEKVSTFEIFCMRRAHNICFKEMSDPVIKRF